MYKMIYIKQNGCIKIIQSRINIIASLYQDNKTINRFLIPEHLANMERLVWMQTIYILLCQLQGQYNHLHLEIDQPIMKVRKSINNHWTTLIPMIRANSINMGFMIRNNKMI